MSTCNFYEGIAKRFKKLKDHDAFFEQERTANPANAMWQQFFYLS